MTGGDHPTYVDSYLILGEILERQGRTDEALELYRQAASNERLPERVRAQFAARTRAMLGS